MERSQLGGVNPKMRERKFKKWCKLKRGDNLKGRQRRAGCSAHAPIMWPIFYYYYYTG
jgi:hypothetical protein